MFFIGFILFFSLGCNNSLKSVKIGSQIWLSEDLDVSNFRNGDIVPQARTSDEWIAAKENHQPAWCYYENKESEYSKWGKLYNWYAVNDPRGLAPIGWRIPTQRDWDELINYCAPKGGYFYSDSSFNPIFGGVRRPDGSFNEAVNFWWTSNEITMNTGWVYGSTILKKGIVKGEEDKGNGLHVRCISETK
jgi:uncharacterized protein (TIGR02145 family)